MFLGRNQQTSQTSRRNLNNLITDFLAQPSNKNSNYYQHHHMPSHSFLKNKDKGKGVFVKRLSPTFSNKRQIGRNIYHSQSQKMKIPGPGFYDVLSSSPKTTVLGFFRRQPSTEDDKRKNKIKKVASSTGPGFYRYQDKDLALSNHKTSQKTTFRPKQVPRFNYKTPLGPGPADYQINTAIYKTSSYKQLQTHSISMTKRSNIINQSKVPGPGQYNWQKYYDKNAKQPPKPVIQYKFVYGHPS